MPGSGTATVTMLVRAWGAPPPPDVPNSRDWFTREIVDEMDFNNPGYFKNISEHYVALPPAHSITPITPLVFALILMLMHYLLPLR